MKIGGFLPLSLCDYPGIPAAVIFTQGCNWRCPFCHNQKLLPLTTQEELHPKEEIIKYLASKTKMLSGVVITGGEPTIQNELEPFFIELKTLGLDIKLDTNGTQPGMVEKLLSQDLVDYIAMDIKAPWDKYDCLAGIPVQTETIKTSIDLIVNSGIAHHFRTTFVPHLLKEHDIEEIKNNLPQGGKHVIQKYKRAVNPPQLPNR